MARELLLNGQSPTGDASLPMKGKNMALPCGVSVQPAQQLDYLARIQGFQVRHATKRVAVVEGKGLKCMQYTDMLMHHTTLVFLYLLSF